MSKKKKRNERQELREKLRQECEGIKILKEKLGLFSFHVFGVGRRKRKHRLDFLAWPKYGADLVFVFDFKPSRGLRVRPLSTPDLTPSLRHVIASTRKACRIRIRRGRQIKPLQKGILPEHWLTPAGIEEFERLTGIELSPKKQKLRSA